MAETLPVRLSITNTAVAGSGVSAVGTLQSAADHFHASTWQPHLRGGGGRKQQATSRSVWTCTAGLLVAAWLGKKRRGSRLRVTALTHEAVEATDPELAALLAQEVQRQEESINLIASENYASAEVREVLASVLSNKYSEGVVGARYYGGNSVIDKVEKLCQERALHAFGLESSEWAVNVQPYSGSPANFAVFTGLLRPHDRIMGLSLSDGGHLTHGHYTPKRRVSASSIYFESLAYGVDKSTGLIDFDGLSRMAHAYQPKIIIAGASAYPRIIDWQRFREICDEVGALLLVDMAHISGLIAGGVHPSPFPFADVVTSTTHKSLRGPRGAMIFCRRALQTQVDNAVFPALQGGPHNATIGALAAQLREVASPKFKKYCKDVVANCQSLAKALADAGCTIATGGTDNHLLLWDLRPVGLTGSKMERLCEYVGITVNRNSLPGDRSPHAPGGVRLGSCAMTTRGATADDFEDIARFLSRARDLALKVQERTGKKLVDFTAGIGQEQGVAELAEEVKHWALARPCPR